MAIYVTGDIHANPHRFSTDNFPIGKELTKEDYVIICGDFGLVWDPLDSDGAESGYERNWLNWLADKPWTTLFVDGNHENFDRLDSMPEVEWNGGKVHMIRPNVIHLMRGYVFNIDGKKVFAFGGASSHDIQDGVLEVGDPRIKEWNHDRFKLFRVNHVSWWEQEMPNEEEMNRGLENLAKVDYKVDYIISHSASTSEQILLHCTGLYNKDKLTDYLEKVKNSVEYKKHFFGHLHLNRVVTEKDICLYEDLIPIERVDLVSDWVDLLLEEGGCC